MIRRSLGLSLALVALALLAGAGYPVQAQVPPADVTVKGISAPAGAYWSSQEVVMEGRQRITHQHGLEFVYALQGDAAVVRDGQTTRIPQGAAAAVPAGATHTHLSPADSSRIAAFQLAPAEATWDGLTVLRARRTGVLESYRPGAQYARLLEVRLQPLSQTAVHTHPGPETTFVLEGPIVVQVEGKLTMLLRGDLYALPGDTVLQARYIGGAGIGRFLALFVVAEEAPFSTPIPAGFKTPPAP
ncbi:MAG TPA: cupin domain-containing protein [bacterium]|nr:cupin domain-containing protein [bacterium]